MREEERFNWWMPPNVWSKKPYRSRWKMSREDAAKHGATEPVEGTRMVIEVPETEEEKEAHRRAMSTSAWQENWKRKPGE